MLVATAHFPNTHVAVVPVFAHIIDLAHNVLPAVMGDRVAVLVGQVHGVHQFAVDIQLNLLVRLVADPHRLRAAVTGQVIEVLLGQFCVAVKGIQNAELLGLLAAVVQSPAHPAHEGIGLIGVTQAHERVHGE
ncbi:hypothetical protein ALO94_200379 [Pseudomonas syringae pv. spinaceae]|uniref:Uncharacterized protein n=1 Tax=Pseudomonas syringae pv. spinaceae TaxID=264459 RepID=A0A0Q0BFY9_PSESX|nr:hypothetical protein ALO94_200379 [Pseudomonas syringae pv. spinaceae]